MRREEIVSILCDLHKTSGFRVSLHGTDFKEIAAYPTERLGFCTLVQRRDEEFHKCEMCDSEASLRVQRTGKTLIYTCRHGLCEVVCPLYNFGTLTGYLMMGQVAGRDTDKTRLEEVLVSLGIGIAEARETVRGIPTLDTDMIDSFVRIMRICAEYMTMTNALPSRAPGLPELAKIYLHENFSERIMIKDICRSLGCSKSALLSSFKTEYGTTVNSYLCEVRINEAKRLLSSTNMSISDVADATGFYDCSYFSKVFSEKVGRSPSEYRKEIRN